MALFKTGTITSPASTGNQSYTGVGFTPKLLIFFSTVTTADGNAATRKEMIGAASGATAEASQSIYDEDAQNITNASRRINKTKCITVASGNEGAAEYEADLVSFDADGFTLNWAITAGSGTEFHYIAIGGADVSAKVATYNVSGSGNQSVTGVGFQPDILMMLHTMDNTTDTTQGWYWYTFGAGISSTSRFTINEVGTDGADTSDNNSIQRSTKIIDTVHNGSSVTSIDLVSMDSDGFTVNNSVISQTPTIIYIAIKGVKKKIAAFNQPTSTGNQSVTGTGFRPGLLILTSWGKASSTSYTAHSMRAFGAATDSADRRAISGAANDNVGTSEADRRSIKTKAITILTAGTPTLNAEADLVSQDLDGFTLNWSTADATAREIYYIALADTGPNVFDSISVSESSSVEISSGVPSLSISVSDAISVTESKTVLIPFFVLNGKGPLADLKFRSIDRMKYTKDLVRAQPADQFIEETADFVGQKFNLSHQGIAIPMDTDADYTSEGVSAPSPNTVLYFIQKWLSEIHGAGDKVLFRGTYNWVEKEADHALYDFKLRVGASRYTLGTIASAPTDGQTTIYGRIHAFIVSLADYWEHGDQFAPFPERGENNTIQRTVTITRSGSTATATTVSGNMDIGDQEPVSVSGAVQSEYNGDFVVTKINDQSFSYTVTGTPATPATGTITVTFGTSPYTQGQAFFPHTGGAQAGYTAFFNDGVDVARNAFRSIKKNVYVGYTSHSWSEIDSGWYQQGLFDKISLTIFDHYGVAHTVAEMETDWDDTYTGKGYPMYHQEWSDYWAGTTTVDATRAAFLRAMYAAAGVRADNGKLIGFNDWSGWDGGTGEEILINNGTAGNPDFALRDRGLILQEAFNGTADSINIYEWAEASIYFPVNESESISVSESVSLSITGGSPTTLEINKSESISVTESYSEIIVSLVNKTETIHVREPSRYALTFNGSSQYGSFTAPFTRTAGQPLSAVTWFRTTQNNTGHRNILAVRSGSGAGDLWKLELNDNKGRFEYDPVGSGAGIEGSVNLNDGLEHLLIGVYNGTNVILYIDGVQAAISGTLASAAIDQTLGAIGRQPDASGEYFAGDIGPSYIFTREITSSEQLAYWNGAPLDLTSLQTGWQMPEGIGTKLGDISSNNVAITLQNSPTWTGGFGAAQQVPQLISNINKSEAISVAESFTVSVETISTLSISVSDSISVAESINRTLVQNTSVQDPIFATDNNQKTGNLFNDSFESGSSSAWSYSDGSPVINTSSQLIGKYGLQVNINGSNSVSKQSLGNKTRVRARFYFDPNSVATMGTNAGTRLLIFRNAAFTYCGFVYLRYNAGFHLQPGIMSDGAVETDGTYTAISDGPHLVELEWKAATSAGANNGYITLFVDGSQVDTVTGIDNDTHSIDVMTFGAMDGFTISGDANIFLDAFVSNDTGAEIGADTFAGNVVEVSLVNVNDQVSVYDIAHYYQDGIYVSESVNIQIVTGSYSVTVSDSISVAESTSIASMLSGINNSESISVTESLGISITSYINKSDSISVSENINLAVASNVNTSENISLTENFSSLTTSYINVDDSISVIDVIQYFPDQVVVLENVKTTLVSNVNKSENITVAESVASFTEILYLNISENILVEEGVNVSLTSASDLQVNVSDAINVAESSDQTSLLNVDLSSFSHHQTFDGVTIPSGWTERQGTWSYNGSAAVFGGGANDPQKVIYTAETFASRRTVKAKIKFTTTPTSDGRIGICIHGVNSGGAAGINLVYHGSSQLRFLHDLIEWGPASALTINPGETWWFKASFDGTTYYGKVWQAGTVEPSSWTLTWTKAQPVGADFSGIVGDSASGVGRAEYDDFLVASNTDIVTVEESYSPNFEFNISINKINFLTEDMTSAPAGTLIGTATYDGVNQWVQLIAGQSNNSGTLYYSDGANLKTESFITYFDWYKSGSADRVHFFWGCTDNAQAGGYQLRLDFFNNRIQLIFNGTTIDTQSPLVMVNGSFVPVVIRVLYLASATQIEVFVNGMRRYIFSDSVRTVPGNFYGWYSFNGGQTSTQRIKSLIIDDISNAETILVAESINFLNEKNINKSESIAVSESKALSLQTSVNSSETISITENANLTHVLNLSASDSVSITEANERRIDSFISESESIAVTENTSPRIAQNANTSDSISISENFNSLITSYINVSEAIVITENVNKTTIGHIDHSDAVIVNENIELSIENHIEASESIIVSENVSLNQISDIYKAETITIAESTTIEPQLAPPFGLDVDHGTGLGPRVYDVEGKVQSRVYEFSIIEDPGKIFGLTLGE